MNSEIKNGYIITKNKEGPVFITLHCGPQYGEVPPRDQGSDMISSKIIKKGKGTLFSVLVPRNQYYGIDMNRAEPDFKKAKNFREEDIDTHAWKAASIKDHKIKKQIFRNFWQDIQNEKGDYIFLHSIIHRIGHIPTILDIITFDGKGISYENGKKLVKNLNNEFSEFLKDCAHEYKQKILIDIKRKEKRFSKKLKVYKKMWLEKDINKIKKRNPKLAKKLIKEFDSKTYIEGVKKTLKSFERPKATLENVFSAKKAFAPKKYLKGKKFIEIESSYFLTKYYPKKAVEMVEYIKENM